jgi:hypothetical protein
MISAFHPLIDGTVPGPRRQSEWVTVAEAFGGFPLFLVLIIVSAGNGDAQSDKRLVAGFAFVFPDCGLDLATKDERAKLEFRFGICCSHGLLLVAKNGLAESTVDPA